MNLPTLIVALIVAGVVAAAVISEVKKHKNGGGCACGCSGCSKACASRKEK